MMFVLCFASVSHAAASPSLQIVAEKANATTGASGIKLNIENTGVEDSLLLWQLAFQIVPVKGRSSGSVSVKSVSTTSDYLFENSFGITENSSAPYFAYCDMGLDSSDTLTAALKAVEVPSSGKSLLQIELNCSGASGDFDVVIIPNNHSYTGSYWTAVDQQDQQTQHDFTVVPVSGIQIQTETGEVNFSVVPEPPCGRMLLSGVLSFAFLVFVWRQRCPHRSYELRDDCLAQSTL
jgi:hypothetical protein